NYILLARALLSGDHYWSGEVACGFPALLIPALAVLGPDNTAEAIPWLKLLVIALFLISLVLVYVLFRMRHSMVQAFAATMLFAISEASLRYAADIMTEIPYIAASFGALLYWQLAISPWAASRQALPTPWGRLLIAGGLI